MLISLQLRTLGLYRAISGASARLRLYPSAWLAMLVTVAGLLFAFLTNLDHRIEPTHNVYYCGDNVRATPEHVDDSLARFRYEFPGEQVFHLNMFPLRKRYVRRLLREVGFQRVTTYGDFQETYQVAEPDFFIHVAEKSYVEGGEEE